MYAALKKEKAVESGCAAENLKKLVMRRLRIANRSTASRAQGKDVMETGEHSHALAHIYIYHSRHTYIETTYVQTHTTHN